MHKLPKLINVILPAILSYKKGIQISKKGIKIDKNYHNVEANKKQIERYIDYFQFFDLNPLTYIYLLAQRAQVQIMLDAAFTIAIPGLIHLDNELQQHAAFNIYVPFDLKASVVVDYKEEGSLIPQFSVEFYQNNALVATCKSTYLAKRKTSKKKPKNNIEALDYYNDIKTVEAVWKYYKNAGRKYSKVSGDRNPIHLHPIFAKLFGLKTTLLQGWEPVSKIAATIQEKEKIKSFSKITVHFKSPVYLPSKQLFTYQKINNTFQFKLTDKSNNKITLLGTLK